MKIETVDKNFEIGIKFKQVLQSIWWIYYKQIGSRGGTSKLYLVAALFDSRQGFQIFYVFRGFPPSDLTEAELVAQLCDVFLSYHFQFIVYQ